MQRSLVFGASVFGAVWLSACTPAYSPNTYSTNAVQQVNKVESGIVIGFRQVMISASGTVGAVTGGAAGGILGAQSETVGLNSALGAVGGTAVGSIIGAAVEHASGDTTGWEYIVRKGNGELLSVTQREAAPLPLGQKVLVIAGPQARIVADYSVDIPSPKPEQAAKAEPPAKPTPEEQPAPPPAAAAQPAASAEEKPTPPATAEQPEEKPEEAPSQPATAEAVPPAVAPLVDNADVAATRAEAARETAAEASPPPAVTPQTDETASPAATSSDAAAVAAP